MFEKGSADWLSELASVINKYNNTIQHSIKMTPNEPSKKIIGKVVFDNLRDDREKRPSKFQLGQLVQTADIKKILSKGDSTNWSYKLYTITEFFHDTIPNYR